MHAKPHNYPKSNIMVILMELKIIENEKKKIILEIVGEDHTLCNALRKELWNDKSVKIAGYNISHPLTASPRIVVETDGKTSPSKALLDAAARLKKDNANLLKEITKAIK